MTTVLRASGLFTVTGAAFALLVGCSPSPEQVAREQAMKGLEQAAKEMEAAGKRAEAAANKGDAGAAMGEAMKVLGVLTGAATGAAGAAGAASYDPVDFRKLREVLPQELAGFEKDESSGERNNMFGIAVSQVKQSFKTADGSRRVTFEVTDPGSLAGPFALANVWLNIEMDKESSSGYEKTSTVNGRKLHEKWQKASKEGEATLVVGNRFLLEIGASGVEMNDVKALLSKVDVAKLEAMKADGKKS